MKKMIVVTLAVAMTLLCTAVAADICSTSGSVITCANPDVGGYTTWKVGRYVSDDADRILACALIGGTWTLVGWESHTTQAFLRVDGNYTTETINVADWASECDAANGYQIEQIPDDWFVQGVEVNGKRGDDVITGSYLDEILNGNEGDDDIYGEGGDDTIHGNQNCDYIEGGDGDDSINGDEDADVIHGQAGIDSISGGGGNDTITGGTYGDTIYGDAGGDTINGNGGDDEIFGGDDVDHIYGDNGKDQLYGGESRDYIYGGAGDDDLYGNDDSGAYDIMYGNGGNDYLHDSGNAICDGGLNPLPVPPNGDTCECFSSLEQGCEY